MEDAGEHFVTEDELKEMGIKSVSTWRPTTFNSKITKELNRLVKKINKSKANSCKIEDQELVDCFVECELPVSDFVKGTRRVGNRLSLFTKSSKTTANKRDGKRFIDSAIRFITIQTNESVGIEDCDFSIEVRGGTENVHEGTFNFIRHNMKWDDYVKYCKDDSYYHTPDAETLKWNKVMYDDPKYFNEIEETA